MRGLQAETIKKRVITLAIMIELRNNYWAVEVPKNAKYHRIDGVPNGAFYELIFYKDSGDIDFPDEIQEVKIIDLPPGTWLIVCTSKTFEAWHALEVLEWFELAAKCGFRDYSQPDDLRYPFEDHQQSLNSLLTSKGCDLNKIYLILKKK